MPDPRSNRLDLAALSGRLPWARSFFLHIAAGFIATAAHYAVMFVLIQLGMAGVLASTLGFTVGAITRFLLSYFHVFEPMSGVGKAMFRFVIALFIQMAANSLLLAMLMTVGLHVWVAQILTTAALTIFTFLGGKLWVFR